MVFVRTTTPCGFRGSLSIDTNAALSRAVAVIVQFGTSRVRPPEPPDAGHHAATGGVAALFPAAPSGTFHLCPITS
jgi:hypothetical protein